MALAPSVAAAIKELERAYPRALIACKEDGQGGALVTVEPVPLGGPYKQRFTWIGFHIPHLYPQADVYPHHLGGDVARVDGAGLGTGTSASSFDGRPSIQLSRRSNRRDANVETALLKMERVLQWVRDK